MVLRMWTHHLMFLVDLDSCCSAWYSACCPFCVWKNLASFCASRNTTLVSTGWDLVLFSLVLVLTVLVLASHDIKLDLGLNSTDLIVLSNVLFSSEIIAIEDLAWMWVAEVICKGNVEKKIFFAVQGGCTKQMSIPAEARLFVKKAVTCLSSLAHGENIYV